MSVTTKVGDRGKTLLKGKMVGKDDQLVEVIGELDELMAVVGLADLGQIGLKINQELYWISGVLAGVNKNVDLEESIKLMEQDIGVMEKEKGEINKFLEAGKDLEPKINLARVVCRRVERRMVKLNKVQQIDPNILIYINRLSDYLFMLSRYKIE